MKIIRLADDLPEVQVGQQGFRYYLKMGTNFWICLDQAGWTWGYFLIKEGRVVGGKYDWNWQAEQALRAAIEDCNGRLDAGARAEREEGGAVPAVSGGREAAGASGR